VFQLPQLLQRPKNWRVWAPQWLQTYELRAVMGPKGCQVQADYFACCTLAVGTFEEMCALAQDLKEHKKYKGPIFPYEIEVRRLNDWGRLPFYYGKGGQRVQYMETDFKDQEAKYYWDHIRGAEIAADKTEEEVMAMLGRAEKKFFWKDE
jgi:hypothetical protein